ncbi:MAG: hypothetical protein ACI92B_001955, partial [Marinobacter maritimus]
NQRTSPGAHEVRFRLQEKRQAFSGSAAKNSPTIAWDFVHKGTLEYGFGKIPLTV